MVIETLPEVQKLSARMKLVLASELMGEYSHSSDPDQEAAIHNLLEQRLAEYRKDPASAISWKNLKELADH